MFTVIFLSRSARSILDRSRAFFEPFEENGSIAFCEWSEVPTAVTLAQALPDLSRIIRGKAAWRAVVVDHTASVDTSARPRDPENPFDFLDNVRAELNLENSKHALVRISHLLLGYPAMTARAFEPMLSYRDRATGTRRERSESEILAVDPAQSFQDAMRELTRTESDVRVRYREIEYSDEEKEIHAQLTEQYQMREVHPTEVVFISTRTPIDEDSRSRLHDAWRSESEQNASRFVERNDYPPSSRFAVYDLLNKESSGYEQDELRFWISVLTVAVNQLPSSAFQAERVYRLGIEFSDESLGEMLNEHVSRLTAIREHLDSQIRRPDRPPETAVSDILQPQKVSVEFEKLGGNEIEVDTVGYGLAADTPRNELSHWAADHAQLTLKASKFVRRPRRVLARAVYDARAKARSFLDREHVLSDIDREEIEDELAKRVRALTEPATTDILDRARLERLLAEQNAQVTRHMAERMRLRTIWIASGIVLAAWVGALLPYLLQAASKGAEAFLWSLLVVVVIAVVLVGVAFATLGWMRSRLIALLRGVNSSMRSFVSRVNGGADVFSGYLSDLATYMYAKAVLIGAGRMQASEQVRRRRLAALRARVVAAIDAEKKIVTSLGQPLTIRRTTAGLAAFDADSERQSKSLFRFPIGDGKASFNTSGESVDAPYEFVRRLTVERVRLFESGPGARS